jgi:hypothetical protein
MSKTNGVYDFEKDFNGKVNDSTFDNSQSLINAITYLMANGGGQLNFGVGNFYFSTPIVFNSYVGGVVLNGITAYGNNRGTNLIYTGTGYFLNFSDLEFSQIRDISINGNGSNNGVYIGISALCDFTRVRLWNFAINLRLYKKTGYVKFLSCSFQASSSTQDCVILGYQETLVGTTSDNNVEYVYFDKCSFEGSFYNATGIKIYFGQFIYFTECDVCNWNGIGIYATMPSTSHIINDLFFTNMSLFRNKIQFKVETTVANNINRINLSGHLVQRDTVTVDDRFIVLSGNTSGLIMYPNMDVSVVNTNENVMTYGVEMYYAQNYDFKIFGRIGKINRASSPGNIHFNALRTSLAVQVPYGSTSYIWTLTPTSPFSYRPTILVSSMDTQNYTWSVSNTFNGNLTITLTFGSALTGASTFLCYISDYTF